MATAQTKKPSKREVAVTLFQARIPELGTLGAKDFRAAVKRDIMKKLKMPMKDPKSIAKASTLYNHAKRACEDAGEVAQFGRARKPEGHVPAEGDTWQAVNEDGVVVDSGRNKKTLKSANKGCTIEAIAS